VDWAVGQRRRRDLEAELERITRALPDLGVKRALLFGSLARGEVRDQSDLDLILIVDTGEPFVERCARFYASLEPRIGMARAEGIPGGTLTVSPPPSDSVFLILHVRRL